MRVGLIDVDGKNFPNIPLMKLSAFHKSKGDTVGWYYPFDERYDLVYVAKVFSFSDDVEDCINADKVIRGGTGYAITLENGKEVYHKDMDLPLNPEIEHIFPDYSIYPQFPDTAFGFLSRGCPRGCSFCIVAGKEGRCSRKVADLSEFWDGQKNVVLCDPNILACKEWKDLLQQLIDSHAEVDFNQGLDIRMMTREKIDMLNDIKIKEIHFAWDRYQDKDLVLPRLEMFSKYYTSGHKGMKSGHKAIVYTIVNFDTTLEQDLDRIYTLRDLGYWAYVMIYDKEHCDQVYKNLQRWCNNRWVFAQVPRFEDYRRESKNMNDNEQLTLF